MGTVTLVGVVQANADSSTGWANGGVDGELSYQGSGSYGGKAGSGTTRFPHTGTARNFSVGGGNEGDHIIVILGSLTPGKLDTKANGGLGVIAGNDGTNFGEWYVDGSDTKSPTSLFLPYIINPAADFDNVSGSFSLTGNPAQLSSADYFGGRFDATSGIMGNFNNALVDQITIGTGLRGTGTGGNIAEWITADEGTVNNRYGYLTTREGVVYFQGKMYFGSSAASYAFSDTDKVIIFPDVVVAADFYEIVVENASSVVTFDGFTIQAPGTPKVSLTHISGTWTIVNSTIDGARIITGASGLSISDTKITNSGTVSIGAGSVTNCVIQNSTDIVAVELASGSTFTGGSITGCDRGLKFPDGAGPFTLDGTSMSGNTVDIQVNSASDVEVNLVNGATATTAENIGAGNATINPPSVSIQFDGAIIGSTLYMEARAGGALTAGAEIIAPTTMTTDPFVVPFSYNGDQPVFYRIRNASGSPAYTPIERPATIGAGGLRETIEQEIN